MALKEILDSAASNPTCLQRFVEEAEITGQLEHPGVVPIHALGTDRDGLPYYAMRFVRGKTLEEAIKEYHRSPAPQQLRSLLRRFVMVCETMAFAHARKIIHRDLKPNNIMLGEFGETLVLDGGLAKPLVRSESTESKQRDLTEQKLPCPGRFRPAGEGKNLAFDDFGTAALAVSAAHKDCV